MTTDSDPTADMRGALIEIIAGAMDEGFCRWCRVLVGCGGHKASSECPVAIAEEELRDAAPVLATVAQPTTPAPAWEHCDDGRGALLHVPPYTLTVYRYTLWRWGVQSWNVIEAGGECPTAPEAARAAVAALRAIVAPVVEALDRVPELEDKP